MNMPTNQTVADKWLSIYQVVCISWWYMMPQFT